MRAARWVVVGTALLAAAVAFYLLIGPGHRTGSGRSTDPGRASRPVTIPEGPASQGPPQEEIDAESRDAMRDFLRKSIDGEDGRARPDAR